MWGFDFMIVLSSLMGKIKNKLILIFNSTLLVCYVVLLYNISMLDVKLIVLTF